MHLRAGRLSGHCVAFQQTQRLDSMPPLILKSHMQLNSSPCMFAADVLGRLRPYPTCMLFVVMQNFVDRYLMRVFRIGYLAVAEFRQEKRFPRMAIGGLPNKLTSTHNKRNPVVMVPGLSLRCKSLRWILLPDHTRMASSAISRS